MKRRGGQGQICAHHVFSFDVAVVVRGWWVLVERVSSGLSRSTMRGPFPTVCCCQSHQG